MAVGVPENDVFAAADAVLARGERPTVERVRQELGRGSPARVASLLDHWWGMLAARLSAETRLPNLPAEISQAFTDVWQQAVLLGEGVAERSLYEQRQVLAEELSKVAAAEDEAQKEVARHRQHASTAIAAQQAAEIRLDDLQRLLAQHLQSIEDLTLQRDSLKDERDAGRERLQALERQSLSDRQDSDQARKSQEAYVRGVEERAHREVDRAREETKSALSQLEQLVKQTEVFQQRWEAARLGLSEAQHQAAMHQASAERGAMEVRQIQSKLEAVQAELQEVIQRAAAEQARADTLERQAALQPQAAGAVKASKNASQNPRKSRKPITGGG